MVDFANMLCGVNQLEADALAMAARREKPVLDDRDLVRHVGVLGVVSEKAFRQLLKEPHNLTSTQPSRMTTFPSPSIARLYSRGAFRNFSR
jgi:hypothetical protein